MPSIQSAPGKSRFSPRLIGPIAVAALQAVAASYFVVDGIDDLIEQAGRGFSVEVMMECLVALALLAGVVLGARHLRRIAGDLARADDALARARGALADHIARRFETWSLTRGESDVALFALKGCDVAEIARLRGAAPGTVRAQLSQVYAKAGVGSQAMLMSLFLEDLLDTDPAAGPRRGK